jgi:hypothetical protein
LPFSSNLCLFDTEGGESFRRFGLDGYVVDRGQAGTGPGPVDQAADIVGRPLEDGFDPAVGQVAHPAGHAMLLGQAAARVAEEDTLDPARDQHPIAHHKQRVRRVPSDRRLDLYPGGYCT